MTTLEQFDGILQNLATELLKVSTVISQEKRHAPQDDFLSGPTYEGQVEIRKVLD